MYSRDCICKGPEVATCLNSPEVIRMPPTGWNRMHWEWGRVVESGRERRSPLTDMVSNVSFYLIICALISSKTSPIKILCLQMK